MKVAIYVRFSSDSQRESSLEDQERLCRQEADRHGYTVQTVYKDAALSGQLAEQRPGLHAMMEAAKRREFDVLIVDDASRLSRDSADALRILHRLEFWGIGLIARTDGINTVQNAKGARLPYAIKSAFNEEFLRDLAEKTWRGQEGRVRNGFSPGGLPYGYRSEPVIGARGKVEGYRRMIHEPEAAIVRRIFRLYAGDEAGRPHSTREIAQLLSKEGVSPPGARWQKRTVRQATTWSYTSLVGYRRLKKGILSNPLYAGRLVWNRSKWLRDPDTKAETYRPRPTAEWVEVDVPELRIVPQDLWDRVQVRLALHDVPRDSKGRRNVGNYLLSGFVKCAVCGGAYIKMNHSYRCGTHRNRGDQVCANSRGVTVERLQRIVISALREKLYTPANLKTLITHVRDELFARAREQARPARSQAEQINELRAIEEEITNIKAAVRLGKATTSLLEMLEDAERRRKALQAGKDAPRSDDMQARLERVLAELPERVQAYLEDLEGLLARDQVQRGKEILASLGTEVVVSPDGTAEIRGDLGKVIRFVGQRRRESSLLWLGEEDSNPR